MKQMVFVILIAASWLTEAAELAVADSIQTSNPQSAELQQKLSIGEAYQSDGNYLSAGREFETVLAQAQKNNDPLSLAMAMGALGYNYYLSADFKKAQSALENALNVATPLPYPALTALIDNYLGMVYLSLQEQEKAGSSFQNALNHAQSTHDEALISGIRLNQAKLEADPGKRMSLLLNIHADALKLADGLVKTRLMSNLGEQLLDLSESLDSAESKQLLKPSYQILNEAYHSKELVNQPRLRAQSAGFLARLYQQQNRDKDALIYLEQAVFFAQLANASDLLMRFETQRAQLLDKNRESDAALAAYRRAADHHAGIRHAIPVYLHDGQSSLKVLVDPVYRGMADILLRQAAKAGSDKDKQALLSEAIDAMERIKYAEMEGFFKNSCLVDEDTSVNLKNSALQPDIGIIYPIILPDRVELLFRAGDSRQIEQSSIQADASEVIEAAEQMGSYLRHAKGNYRPAARQLYNWLLKANDDRLKAKGITTLLYVPDGPLRQVPFAALLNDKQFAVESYAVVTLPGLTLKKIQQDKIMDRQALIAGLSKPDGPSLDDVIQHFSPDSFGTRSVVNDSKSQQTHALTPEERSAYIEKLSLPGIEKEVSALQKTIPHTSLENQQFTFKKFKQSLGSGDFSVIHVASHGHFGKDAEDSFIMTYDQNIRLLGEDSFQSLLNDENIKKSGIDLLTLSACKTAEGDDRALLGFSGIAIMTNALSALGTLWPIDDQAAAKFMGVFYGSISQASTKAQSLREAQLALLHDKTLKHPYFWAPFILVGNWL